MSHHTTTGNWTKAVERGSGPWPEVAGYEILGELGRGGMGVVYKARQMAKGQLVALKLIRDGALAGPQDLGRFRIEAEAAARMRHPNIVAIDEVGEQQGRPFYAMELVEGGSLAQHLAGRPQPPREAAEVIRTLALAVQHAHEQHVVHRDLKPANILLGGISCLLPKIADFGLAKRLDSQSTAWTQEGAILGTASYMAPEQAAGRVHEVGPAVDIYALGAILYELLTGRPPFQAPSWQQTIQQVINDEPAPLVRMCPETPADLETVCLKCLEKEPSQRYASALELANDLGRYLNAQPLAAVPLSETERHARLLRREGYEVVDVIGRGPRSTVYHAVNATGKQPVAMKLFTSGILPQDAWEARMRRCADIAGMLAHPNIVSIQRSGWRDGIPYLILEYAPHGSLAAKLAGKPMATAAALDLMLQLAETISYLHRQGVIHGNLKPSNVLLAADDIPRITDFRATGGLFFGTIIEDPVEAGQSYLTPEFILKPDSEPRFYTDIYGLGVIFYELLTGRPPFLAESSRELLEQIRSQPPIPPSHLNSNVPPPVETACLRCLQKNPWMRFARAYDFYLRLQYLQKKLP